VEQPHQRFDSYLQLMNSNELQRMARIWGTRGALRKDAAIIAISEGLSDQRMVDAAIIQLDAIELAALSIMRRIGGIIRSSHLAIALRAAGYQPPETPDMYGNTSSPFAQRLCERGLALPIEQRYGYFSPYSDLVVFSDDRLLARVPALKVKQITLLAAPEPPESRIRRPAQVALDLIGVVEAIRAQGGLQLTKSNAVRVTDMRKLSKTLGWGEAEAHFDGLLFTRPVQGLVETLTNTGHLVAINSERLMVSNSDIATLPYPTLVAEVLGQFIGIQSWYEYDLPYWSETFANTGAGMRLAMLMLFECMLDTQSFVSLETFSRTLFDRIGQHYSLNGPHPRVARPWNMQRPRGRTKAEQKTTPVDEQGWLERLWGEWRLYEERWITYALAGWLYFLGMVEVGIEDGQLNALRLTDLARAVLRPQAQVKPAEPAVAPWIIQPNYEIVVYLEQAAPTQLALLERAAERVQADIHVARYRLTRESVARWTDRSGTLDSLLAALGPSVPQNVAATMREWVTQHERITMRRRANLLKYPTSAARDAALSNGVSGRPIGELFVLLDTAILPQRITTSINYLDPPPATLKVDETGQIDVVRGKPDLLTEPLLDRWAERVGDHWKLTAASVGAAAQRGYRIDDFSREFDQRLTRAIPPVLTVALRAWAGAPAQTELGRISILRLADPNVAQALLASKRFSPLIRGQAGDHILLIERANLTKIRELLQWAGITAAEIDE